jgi:hypothetical protein
MFENEEKYQACRSDVVGLCGLLTERRVQIGWKRNIVLL